MNKKIKTKFGTITCSETNIKWDLDKTKLTIRTNAIDLQIPYEYVKSIMDVE